MKLEGRVAIVTGGSTGIGKGIVLALAKAGADVAFCYIGNERDEAEARKTAGEVEALRGRTLCFRADVTDYEKVKEMVARTLETFGSVDILVNNAGIYGSGRYLADEDIESMRRVIDTHVFGSFYFVKEILPHMRKRERGDIYFISSVATLVYRVGVASYSMAKASLEAMAKSLAREELPNKIRVNAIAPGVIKTDMALRIWQKWRNIKDMNELEAIMPFGRVGKPEDVGNLIAFLASDEGGWISGQVIYVDGGTRGFSVPLFLSSG
jgi:3-oxoacyl-[acyl-carrier protein] reductase